MSAPRLAVINRTVGHDVTGAEPGKRNWKKVVIWREIL